MNNLFNIWNLADLCISRTDGHINLANPSHFDEKTHISIVIFKVEAIFWNRKWVKWIIYLIFETWLITVSQERLVVWTSLNPHFDEKTHILNVNFKAGANVWNGKWLKMNNLSNICVRQTDRQSERLAERETHLEMTLFLAIFTSNNLGKQGPQLDTNKTHGLVYKTNLQNQWVQRTRVNL